MDWRGQAFRGWTNPQGTISGTRICQNFGWHDIYAKMGEQQRIEINRNASDGSFCRKSLRIPTFQSRESAIRASKSFFLNNSIQAI